MRKIVRTKASNESPLKELQEVGIKLLMPHPPPQLQEQKSYKCTGDFKEDFIALCQEWKISYIPTIVPRPHRLDTNVDPCDSRSGRRNTKLRAIKGPEMAKSLQARKRRLGKVRDDYTTGISTSSLEASVRQLSVSVPRRELLNRHRIASCLENVVLPDHGIKEVIPTEPRGNTLRRQTQPVLRKLSSRQVFSADSKSSASKALLKKDSTTSTSKRVTYTPESSPNISVPVSSGSSRHIPPAESKDGAYPSQPDSQTTQSTDYSEELRTSNKTGRMSFIEPRIQVEQDDPTDATAVTEVYIRGWEVDMAMMEVLVRCLPALSQLRLLHLWNAGLSQCTVNLLATFLPLCTNVTTLQLDGNLLAGVPLDRMLDESSLLLHVSLRFCGLTHLDGQILGACLARPNLGLLTLNLSSNKLGDSGTSFLAEGLKINRTLLTLNLTANGIGDQGAQQLAVALSQFPANPRELFERRLMLFHKAEKENMPPSIYRNNAKMGRPLLSPQSPKQQRPGKELKEKVKVIKTMQVFDASKKKKSGTEGPVSRKVSSSPSKSPRPRKGRKKERQKESQDAFNEQYLSCPFTDVGSMREDGNLYLPANRTLLSLNLSRNRIGEAGFKFLLAAVEDQGRPIHNCRQQVPGLSRLELHHNSAPDSCASAREIRHYMRVRDPFLRSPRINLHKVNITPCSMPVVF